MFSFPLFLFQMSSIGNFSTRLDPACHRCDSGHQKLSQGHVIWVWRESLDGHTHEWMERQRHIHTHGMDGQTDIDTFMPKWDYFVLKAAPRLFHE